MPVLILNKGEIFMRINFYDTKITEEHQTVLVKEKAINYSIERFDKPQLITDLMNQMFDLRNVGEEHCYVLAMNTKCRIIGVFFLSKGTVNRSFVGVREVFMRALLIGASHIILLHNHPSKDCHPSMEDIALTQRMEEAGSFLGVPLTDHIIVGGDNFYSFKEHEIL